MVIDNEKKIILLYVMDILRDYSDKDHTLTYAQIQKKLENIYFVSSNIKSVARNVETLTNYGYDIIRIKNKGCYLNDRDFNNAEVMYLVDAVFSAKSIPSANAKELINKLTKNCSIFERKKYKHVYKVEDVARTKNDQLYKTIEILDKAIENKKKVSFQYNEFDITKNFKPRSKGKAFVINPYFLVNNRGKYYLVCNYDKYNDISNYKIENISNIKVLDEDRKPIKELDDCENFSIKGYINEHIYMTNGRSVKVKLEIDNSKTLNDIFDWFGDDILITNNNDKIFTEFKVNENAIIYWILQYGRQVKLISPQETKDKIKEEIAYLQDKYV